MQGRIFSLIFILLSHSTAAQKANAVLVSFELDSEQLNQFALAANDRSKAAVEILGKNRPLDKIEKLLNKLYKRIPSTAEYERSVKIGHKITKLKNRIDNFMYTTQKLMLAGSRAVLMQEPTYNVLVEDMEKLYDFLGQKMTFILDVKNGLRKFEAVFEPLKTRLAEFDYQQFKNNHESLTGWSNIDQRDMALYKKINMLYLPSADIMPSKEVYDRISLLTSTVHTISAKVDYICGLTGGNVGTNIRCTQARKMQDIIEGSYEKIKNAFYHVGGLLRQEGDEVLTFTRQVKALIQHRSSSTWHDVKNIQDQLKAYSLILDKYERKLTKKRYIAPNIEEPYSPERENIKRYTAASIRKLSNNLFRYTDNFNANNLKIGRDINLIHWKSLIREAVLSSINQYDNKIGFTQEVAVKGFVLTVSKNHPKYTKRQFKVDGGVCELYTAYTFGDNFSLNLNELNNTSTADLKPLGNKIAFPFTRSDLKFESANMAVVVEVPESLLDSFADRKTEPNLKFDKCRIAVLESNTIQLSLTIHKCSECRRLLI